MATNFSHRVDRGNVEPGHRLRQDQPRLQALLRRADGEAPPRNGAGNYRNGFKLTLQPHMLELPLRWKKPMTIFVNSMSDLFHEDVPTDFIQQVFAVMRKASWHSFQVLTKRADRVARLDPELAWTPNIWMGTSVESAKYERRIDELRKARAHVRFLSLEPLLGSLPDLDLSGIHWAIVGGESGPGARQSDEARVGGRHPRPVRPCGRPVLLQAVGRRPQKENRPLSRRPHVG